MHLLKQLILALLVPTGLSASVKRAGPVCNEFTVPITASAPSKNLPGLDPSRLSDPDYLVNYVLSQASSGTNGPETSGTYNIAVRYCQPEVAVAPRANTIQVLQHAITMTKDYWNGLGFPVGYNGNLYSWTAYASSKGYHTLAIDNLGSGGSQRPNAIKDVQMPLQTEIINNIIVKLRAGNLHPSLSGTQFSKVIFAGHSYGAIIGNALATYHPESLNAIILTGYTLQFKTGIVPLAAGIALPAAVARPDRYLFLATQPAYLAQSYPPGRVKGLYTTPQIGGYDPAVAQVDFEREGTVAVGELATLFWGIAPADRYTGDVFVLTGKNDAICCYRPAEDRADCGPNGEVVEASRGYFPNARAFAKWVPDLTGHNPNLHFSAPDSFVRVHDWLDARGY